MAYRTLNPFTEQLVREYPEHTDAQVEAALAKADALFRSDWSQGDMAPRLAVLARMAELLTERSDTLAQAMATEMGKLVEQGAGEIQLCAGIAKYYAENAAEFLKPETIDTDLGEAWVQHHPIGVLIAVEPWNFPIYQLIRVIAPAIAVGNPVMFKHAGIVPHCAELFEQLVRDAGAPEGAVTNLYVSSGTVAELIGDDRVQGVALTGSEDAGSKVSARASEKLKKSTLELGGADVFVVLDDADIERAAEIGTQARLANAGQVCTAAKRFIVHEAVAEAFLTAFKANMGAAVLGDPMDPSTTLGPLSSEDALNGLEKQVDAAVSAGATVLAGGKRADRTGFFFEPTILTDIARDNPAYFEEFFGPVAMVHVVKDDDEVVRIANDSHYGLGGSIFAGDIDRARTLATRIETGMVFINTATTSMPELPFGGVKRSGFGRELGDVGIKEFVNRKLVVIASGEAVQTVG
ncbi:NAD-dependent succinate-semialdehyde dehydrogenase [Brevundimonas subvibrioides]|uniref:Aldehyde Dehydrogenase n=1 Tax=Brevundimonas subvibrioides (strain ATCC 15264 / DSM 4735 / LMG 14903 / NBRC 16000 / CB 81) TaxID=633149 RepID=D9QJP6_BRESC|nr:NAD-dependent succinate-semialdehyde dehydrogenase [Brevundimonas subvibrioides]ADK99647.1 Aldehyde Dehydrogenase [Brevundimonas subvibrioides ATCC 15264]